MKTTTVRPSRIVSSLALLLGLAITGCASSDSDTPATGGQSGGRSGAGKAGSGPGAAAYGLWSTGREPSADLLEACEVIFTQTEAESSDEIVIVVDATATVPDQGLPPSLIDDLVEVSKEGGTVSIIGVGGRGVAPSVLAKRVPIGAPSIDGERDTEDIADFAALVPDCVAGMFLTRAHPTTPGTDLYRAMAAAAEMITPDTRAVWTLSDLLANSGQLDLTASLLALDPEQAATVAVRDAGLSLGRRPWHVSGLANATSALQPASRAWMRSFAVALCDRWGGAECDAIALEPTDTARAGVESLSADAVPPFPEVTSKPAANDRPDTCEYTLPAVLAFAGDSAEVTPEAAGSLTAPIERLLATRARARVVGHTASSSGYTRGELMTLSRERAEAVAEVLRAAGVPSGRIAARGVGDTEPLAEDIDPATGRQIPERAAAERRVTITLDVACRR